MGCQAQVWIGVSCKNPKDIETLLGRKLTKDEEGENYHETEYKTGIVLRRKNNKGEEVTLPVTFKWCYDLEMRVCFEEKNGVLTGDDFFGVVLNSRYTPGFIDCDTKNGEGDYFELKLEELDSHLKEIQKKIPQARLYIIHQWF